jgi:hypothetical protein
MTTNYVRVIDGVTYDFSDFDVTWQFVNDKIVEIVQEIIDTFVQSRKRLRDGRETFESYLRRIETDSKQQTQAVTKRVQYDINDALDELIERYNLKDIIKGGDGSGKDYLHVPTETPVELKTSGGEDKQDACLGNISSSVKVDDTIVMRYKLTDNRISHWQCVCIKNSNEKWKNYNPIRYKRDKKTRQFILDANGNKIRQDSSYSSLKAQLKDKDDIVCYSGDIDLKDLWIYFIKEEINA